jgi:hypothetical protein
MDHSPFEGLFKTLLPIIIFIIWAMVSGSAQRRKKEQAVLKRQKQQEIETAGETASETDRPSNQKVQEPDATKKEDWKRSIEDVLEEFGLPIERKPIPQTINQPAEKTAAAPVEHSPEEESQSLEDMEPEVVPEKAIDEKMKAHLAIQESAYTLSASPIDNQKAYSITTFDSMPASGSDGAPHETLQIENASARDLQKFVVWSELLGKPVALRDYEVSAAHF